MNDYEEQQAQAQGITNKQCDAWIKRIEKRWGTLCNESGQELSIEEKRDMARRDLATSPHRRKKKSNEEVSTKKAINKPSKCKNDLAATIIPEAIVVSQSNSCSSLLIRAGYQNIVNSMIIPSTEYLINNFYQNPNCVTLRKLGKIAQTADIVAYAIEHESPTAPAPILRFTSKRFLTPELCMKACSINGLNLQYVPEKWQTHEMYECAAHNIHSEPESILEYIPHNSEVVPMKNHFEQQQKTDTRILSYETTQLTLPPTSNCKLVTPITESCLQKGVNDKQTFYYISDIHIEHQLNIMGKPLSEVNCLIREKVIELVMSIQEKNSTILIAGDVADSYTVFEIFYRELVGVLSEAALRNVQVISVLGNHELWNSDGPEIKVDVDNIIQKFQAGSNSIFLLENALFLMYRNRFPIVLRENILKEANEAELITICEESTCIILGGIGFSGLNPQFNANNGIYRGSVSDNEDISRTMRFQAIYQKVMRCAGGQEVIVLTHTPVSNWWKEKLNANWVYVNGHTHKNALTQEQNGAIVFANNQIGYVPTSWKFKSFPATNPSRYDIFKDLNDGIYSITVQQYFDFNQGQGIDVNCTAQLEPIYMIKRSDAYMFFQQKENLYLLCGGKTRKLTHDIQYYYDNLPLYQQRVTKAFQPYQTALKILSKEVQVFGGCGTVHGCIIDIDDTSHIYLNPFDGTITPYFAWNMTEKYLFSSTSKLLEEAQHLTAPQIPGLALPDPHFTERYERAFHAGLVPILGAQEIGESTTLATVPELVLDRSMYGPSRIMRSIQYIFDHNVVRIWKDEILSQHALECLPSGNDLSTQL